MRLVSLLLSFHAPTPEKVKKLQDLVYTAVEISYSVALCTRCNFVFDISSVKQQKGSTRLKPFCETPSFLKSTHYH